MRYSRLAVKNFMLSSHSLCNAIFRFIFPVQSTVALNIFLKTTFLIHEFF